MAKALVVVDVQNDFCTGTLAVEDGLTVARGIAAYLQDAAPSYDYIVTTQDWHIDSGEHFSDQPDFRDSWPTHCVAVSPLLVKPYILQNFREFVEN